MTKPARSAFVLGATGFVGGHLLEVLAQTHPELHLRCLVRSASTQKVQGLQALNTNVEVIDGSLEDSALIADAAETADIIVNVASSDHLPSVEAILAGLKRDIAQNSHRRPIYLHMSGLGVIADNVKGEKIQHPKEWTDVGFKLEDCPPENPHLAVDRQILALSSASQCRVRTFILFPGLIYGIGNSPRSGAWVPFFSGFAKAVGHAGTWGPGEVTQYCVHVKDVAQAVSCVLDAAQGGELGDDSSGFLRDFDGADNVVEADQWHPRKGESFFRPYSVDELTNGRQIMFAKGLLSTPKEQPFPAAITDPLGPFGWSLLGSNGHARADRLAMLGWSAEWSKKEPLADTISDMLDLGLTGA
ncbi:hypothetical protein LTR53_008454 [Teratosphaeriaceae sp. CCFEE 6253]|nr:hypothetical protein LTR53_008454 [Teratosphaeriaceae sp. CCFEE 6253]